MKRLLQHIKKPKNPKGLVKRAVALVMAFVFIATGDTSAFARDILGGAITAQAAAKNEYVFEVVTGIHPGTDIQFLEIQYMGTDNKQYRQLFFPNQDSQYLGRLQAEKAGTDAGIANDIKKMYGYTGKTDRFDTTKSSLAQYSSAQFYFTTDVPIKSVVYFDGFTGKGDSPWTCQGMRLFKVTKLGGLRMAGEWSNTWYVDFEGDLIAELPISTIKKYNWSKLEPGYLDMSVDAKVRQGSELEGKDYVKHKLQETDHKYGFRFDFVDSFGSGLESLANDYDSNKANLNQLSMIESFCLNITYTDVYGETRFLYLPGATSAAYWTYANMSKDDRKKAVLGIAQQGGQLVFAGTIPDCAKIDDVSVAVGTEKAESMADIGYNSGNIEYNRWTNSLGVSEKRTVNKSAEQKIHDRKAEASKKDGAGLLCSAIYDMSNTTIKPKTRNAFLDYTFTGDPVYAQSASTASGKSLIAGSVNAVALKQDKKLSLPNDTNNYYAIQFTTENVVASKDVKGFSFKLSYVNTKGENQTTDPINVKDAVLDYYGYWPGSTNGDDFAYKWTTGSGKTTSFMFALKDVRYFTGATISASENGSEDYQIKDIAMYSLTRKNNIREAEWTEKKTENGISTYLNIYRDLDSDAIKIANIAETTLIQNGDEVNVDFTSSKVDAVKDEGYDFTQYAISYADAMKSHGFTKKRKSYEVKVSIFDDTVATDDNGNVVSTGGNGDAGSENKFFFQLQFEYGTSAYVLGNQGLSEGDKFISGRVHTFTVDMNEDYGNVTGINIISDDIDENSKPEDKLRVEEIQVTEVAAAGTHICWVASNVGWIGNDYSDNRNKFGGTGKAGRSAAELAHTVNIDYTTNVVQLEFALTTGTYGEQGLTDKEAEAIGVEPGTQPKSQLNGTIDALLTYTRSDGAIKSEKFDLVEALYNYRNKTAPKEKGQAYSDKASMFRGGHTDRFLLNISDIASLNHLDMSVTAVDYPVVWNVTGLSAKIVKEAGKLKINQLDEYEYDRGKEDPVAYMDKDKYSFIIGGSSQPCNIYFDENEIKIDPQLRTATSVIERTPSSANDTLNVFVFPKDDGSNSGIDTYDVGVKVWYNHLFSSTYQAGDSKMKKYKSEDGQEIFYSMGLNASCMSDLSEIILEADSKYVDHAYMDYAIVQQVRSGVVINTYFVDVDADVFYTTHRAPTGDLASIGYTERQKVYLQVAEGTAAKNLLAEKQDIAFAITYKVPFDVSNTEYQSPYVYATDEMVKKLYGGQVIGIDYSQMFVGEITGIRIATTGSVEAQIGCACVANYHISPDGEYVLAGYYNFADGVKATTQAVKMHCTSKGSDTDGAVRHLSLSFKSSFPASGYESGSTTPIKFTLYTVQDDKVNDPIEIADLRKYINDGSTNFDTGETKTVEMLITGATGLRRIIIEPQSEAHDGSAGWSVESVVAQLDNDTPITRTVGERIYEGRPKTILLSDLSISAEVYNYNYSRNDDTYDQTNIRQGDDTKLIMKSNNPLHIIPTSNGSEYGCLVYATEITSGEFESGKLEGVITHKEDSKRYSFNAPESSEEKTYRIYIASAEVPEVYITLDVTVRPTVKISGSVGVYSDESGAYALNVADQEHQASATVYDDNLHPVQITPNVSGSDGGCRITVKDASGAEVQGAIKQNGNEYEFYAPEGSAGNTYTIRVEATEEPAKAFTVKVTVVSVPTESEGDTTTGSGSTDDTVSGNSVPAEGTQAENPTGSTGSETVSDNTGSETVSDNTGSETVSGNTASGN